MWLLQYAFHQQQIIFFLFQMHLKVILISAKIDMKFKETKIIKAMRRGVFVALIIKILSPYISSYDLFSQ